MITVKYKYDKVYLYLLLSIVLICLFMWGFYNAEELALKEVGSYSRYRWVKKLFYKNEVLLKTVTAVFVLMFLWFSIKLITFLIRRKTVFNILDNTLYKGKTKIVSIKNINKLEFRKVQQNSFIMIHLNDYELFLKHSNFFKRMRYQTLKFGKEKSIALNISFLDVEPKLFLNSLKKMISN